MRLIGQEGITKIMAIALIIIIITIAGIGTYIFTRPTPVRKVKVAVVTDVGGRGDLGFNDMGFSGADKAAKDFGIEVLELISKTDKDYVPNLTLAAEDPDVTLVVGMGFLLTDAVKEVAPRFPEKNFMVVTGVNTGLPNVLSVETAEEQEGAMAGAIAGLLAAHYGYPHAGVVLGMEFPDLWNFEIGYKWGVDWALSWYENKFGKIPLMGSIPRKERVLWTYIGSFTDITKGYLAAKPMYERGAVAVYNVAGGAGLGIKDALAELATIKGLEMGPPFWIGVDANQDWILPGFTIASTMGRFDRAVYYSTKLVLENKFRDVIKESGGKVTFKLMTEVGGLKIAGLSLSTLDDLDEFIEMGMKAENYVGRKVLPMSPEEIRNRVKKMREAQPSWLWEGVTELQDKIIKGEIVVPITETKEAIDYWRGLLG